MKKMFSCSTSQVAVESWNKHDQKLFEAVEKGDVGRVAVLASRKTARPTKLNALGQSAFHLAASKGLTECLTILLSHGAEVNEKNDDGSTALHLATIACQPQCVKVLLQHGANEDCVDGENRTPLHWAASSGCASSVLLLCDQEAFLDVIDNNGRTPLMIAAVGNHPTICCQLLQRGASGHLTDKDQKTALILACENSSVESAELLVSSGVDLSVVDRMGHDALHYALQSQSRPLRRLLRSALKKRKRRGFGFHGDCRMDEGQGQSQKINRRNGSKSISASFVEDNKKALRLGRKFSLVANAQDWESGDLALLLGDAGTGRSRRQGSSPLCATESFKISFSVFIFPLAEHGPGRQTGATAQVTAEPLERSSSSTTLQSEGGGATDGDEEDLDAEEWRCRYEDEQTKVLQLEEQLVRKAKECDALVEGCKVMKERIWDQVQEISQLLPERADEGRRVLSRRYSRDTTEEDYYLNLLAEQVQELKKRQQEAGRGGGQNVAVKEERIQWPGEEEEEEKRHHQEELQRLQAEVATALQGKESATKRVVEIEGHLENMRAVIAVYEAKKRAHGEALEQLQARVAELDGDNQRLRGLLGKQQGESQKAGRQEVDQKGPRAALCAELGQFLSWMREAADRAQEEKAAVLAENEALKREAEEALGGKFHLEAVPSEAIRKSVASWEKMVMGLERALAKMDEANSSLLEKARPLQEAISAPQSKQESGVLVNGMVASQLQELRNGLEQHEEESNVFRDEAESPLRQPQSPEELEKGRMEKNPLQDGPHGQLRPRLRNDSVETKGQARRRSSDLEKEVSDLRQNNVSLMNELAQLGQEREKLQDELQRLWQHQKEGSPQGEAQGLVEELRQRVAALSRELSAEKEETKKLRLRLETQKREMVVLRDSFLKQMMGEANSVGSQSLSTCILEELHWKLDNLVKKHNEALQLVSEIEEESQVLVGDQAPAVQCEAIDAAVAGEKSPQSHSLERDLWELKEELEAAQATLGGESHDVTKLKQMLDRLPVKVAELCSEEEETLRMHEKAWSSLALQTQALEEELRALQEKHEEVRGKSAQREEALAAEKHKNKDLLAKMAEQEKEAGELRGMSEQLERTIQKLNKKVEELSRTCQDKEGKIKKLLKETEKLSAEILALRSESARLQLQLEVKEKNHQEIVTIYRTHLLNAAQGFMDEEVHSMLLRILRAKEE
ncbi:ankyrin repeat domain-containing protein 35 [Terrapene carolina triunguis]|uniref:ankyrin repeat domain-containing protein 35 n=1 Tax=Terrapene triunguis TaxID=2587831 RepID=UPI000E7752B6|nr:ankyrin repeat domain-containing protein 35 [Terrapene carolina triunguis]